MRQNKHLYESLVERATALFPVFLFRVVVHLLPLQNKQVTIFLSGPEKKSKMAKFRDIPGSSFKIDEQFIFHHFIRICIIPQLLQNVEEFYIPWNSLLPHPYSPGLTTRPRAVIDETFT